MEEISADDFMGTWRLISLFSLSSHSFPHLIQKGSIKYYNCSCGCCPYMQQYFKTKMQFNLIRCSKVSSRSLIDVDSDRLRCCYSCVRTLEKDTGIWSMEMENQKALIRRNTVPICTQTHDRWTQYSAVSEWSQSALSFDTCSNMNTIDTDLGGKWRKSDVNS